MFKVIRSALVAVSASISLVAASAPSHAVAGALTCCTDFYQASSGIMFQYNAGINSYTRMSGAVNNLSSLNLIWHNTADKFIRGVGNSTTLDKIYNDGSHDAGSGATGTAMKTTADDFVAPNRFLTTDSTGGLFR